MHPNFVRKYIPIALILLLATFLRTANIGDLPLSTDASVHSLKALAIARDGKFTLIGTPMSVGLWHSPLPIYLYAIPYFFSPDPRLAQIFTAVMNLFAVCLVYLIGKRYMSPRAGLIAALLYTVHPEAIFAARAIWNPNLGAPFVMLYVLTGLLGYYDGKWWARIAHPAMLSLAGQCHPSTFLLAPLTLVLWFYAWKQDIGGRRQLAWQVLAGCILAFLLLLPWGVGLYDYMQHSGDQAQAEIHLLHNRGLDYLFTQTYDVLGNWAPGPTKPIQPILTLLSTIWLVTTALRRRERLPGLIVALGFFLVPLMALALDIPYRGYHIRPSYPNAFLIQGAILGGVTSIHTRQGRGIWDWRGFAYNPYLKWLAPPILAALLLAQLQYYACYIQPKSRPYLREHLDAVATASDLAHDTGRDLILLIPFRKQAEPYWQWEVMNRWAIISQGQDSRTVWSGRGMPLPENGAILLGPADYLERPFVFSGGEVIERSFRMVELPPADHFDPDLRSLDPIRFSNGTQVLGFLREALDSLPLAGQPWTVLMIWQVDALPVTEYKVFLHLIDSEGRQYAQLDLAGLPVGQWRVGERVLHRFDLQVAETLPATGPLFLRFGMYNESEKAEVIDSDGNQIGTTHGLLQIRGQPEPLLSWPQGLLLDQLMLSDLVQQGQPLDVWATWYTLQAPKHDLGLRWRLLAAEGEVAFEQRGNLVSAHPTSSWPSGIFVPGYYYLRVPTDLDAGTYTLELQLLDNAGTAIGSPYRHPIEIGARDRRFAPPTMQHPVGAHFGDELALLGYDLQFDGHILKLVLHWQALDQVMHNYNYFVHVRQGAQVLAQADGVPDEGRYPTSWWAPGEVFSNPIQIDLSALPPGTYTVTTGFYDLGSGEGLSLSLPGETDLLDGHLILQDITLD